jgi:hypothetical protein
MSKVSRRKKNELSGHAPQTGVRVMAGSIVLSVVLGTLALHVAQASAHAQDGAGAQNNAAPQNKRDIQVNSLPFKNLLSKGRRMAGRGELHLDGTVELSVEADYDGDGSLANVIVGGASLGDDKIRELTYDFVNALYESRILRAVGEAHHLWMTFRLDGQRLTASFTAELASEQRAAEMARGYEGMLTIVRSLKKDASEAVIYQNMTASSSGKRLAIRLEMSRETLGNLLLKQITPN